MKTHNLVYVTCIILFMQIFLLNFISAVNVTLTPNPMDISQKVGTNQTYTIQINNSLNIDIFDVKFTNLTGLGFTFPLNLTVPKNSTITTNFTLSPTQSLSENKISKVEFKFLADIPTEITTYNINITNTGFSNNYLVVRSGDTVTWTNKDTIFHNVFSSFFNNNINPNQTFSYTFNTVGVYNYQDSGWSVFNEYHGIIEVIPRTSQERVHNPNYDFNWNLGLNFFLNPTNITFELLEETFQVGATGSTEGILRLKNVGTEVAERIKLSSSSNWVTFEENDFSLSTNIQNLVTYKISPVIFNTADTNKTYTIELTVKGSNTDPITRNISVFIPYTQVFSDTETDAGFLVWFAEVYCPAHPNLFLCNPNQTVVTSSNGSSGNLTLNVSSVDFYNQQRQMAEQGTAVIRLQNDVGGLNEKYASLETIANVSNTSLEYQRERDRITKRDSNVRTIFYLFIFLGTLSYLSFRKYRSYKEKKSLVEGAYEYKT